MRRKNTQPRPKPLRRRAEELDTHSVDDVQICPGTPDKSDACGKRRSLSSPELKKQKLLGNAGEGVDDLESWADELETELLGSNEHESDESKESSWPVDIAGKSLLDEINFKESEERKLHEKISSIEGSKSTTDQPADFINNCNSPLKLTPQSCNNPGSDSAFGTNTSSSSTNIDGGHDQWWKLSTDNENYSSIFSSIYDGSWIENHKPLGDFEEEMMRKTGLEQHQSCATAARTSGCTSTPFPCQSGKCQTDSFEAVYSRQSSTVQDQQFVMNPHPSPEVLLIDSLRPRQYELHKNDELIIID